MSWKAALFELDSQPLEDLDELMTKSTQVKNHDVGLINPNSGSGLLVRDNGTIEGFSDYGLGFRIDPATQSFSVFAPKIKLFSESIEKFSYEKGAYFIQQEYEDVLLLTKKEAAHGQKL